MGYVGRDVDTIIRDLTEYSIKQTRELEMRRVRTQAEDAAEDRILDALVPPARGVSGEPERGEDNSARQTFRKRLREGKIDDLEIEIEVAQAAPQMDVMTPPGMEEMAEQLRGMFAGLARDKTKPKKMKVRDAFKLIVDEEAAKRINEEDLRTAAINNVEQNGIVFLDEIDKIAARQETGGADVSRQGVQRDLLPLVEGTTVNTRYGMVRTDHILFIASGAFHLSRPSDLIPELQGRFPIRVELDSLSAEDFVRILSSTDASLTKQYTALMATEGLELEFTEEGVRRLAELAYDVNETTENIGARRLYTVMEKLLDELSFDATSTSDKTVKIDAAYVNAQLAEAASSQIWRATCCKARSGPGRSPTVKPAAIARGGLFLRVLFDSSVGEGSPTSGPGPAQLLIAVTTYLPSLRSAVNFTLSPALILASSAGSASYTSVMAGRSSALIASCLMVTLPAAGSTRRTSPLASACWAKASGVDTTAIAVAIAMGWRICG